MKQRSGLVPRGLWEVSFDSNNIIRVYAAPASTSPNARQFDCQMDAYALYFFEGNSFEDIKVIGLNLAGEYKLVQHEKHKPS